MEGPWFWRKRERLTDSDNGLPMARRATEEQDASSLHDRKIGYRAVREPCRPFDGRKLTRPAD
jgi:hypothetical protein